MRPSIPAILACCLSVCHPAWADPQFKLLVLAAPNKYHYEYIPVAREGFEQLGKLHAFEMTYATQLWALDGDLKQYAAIVLLNTSGEEFSEAQRRKFEDYVAGGGNVAVVHRAIIIPPGKWPWYEKLVGRSFTIHPMMQTAVVRTVDKAFPATFGVPERWIWSDEWYELANPYNVAIRPVLNVDERSYDPTKIWPGQVAKGMGAEHPVSWYHHVGSVSSNGGHGGAAGRSRVFVTALGHDVNMYRDRHYLDHLYGGIWWAATGKGIVAP
jgi:type 1 glutamine amidotransferase